MYNTMFAGVGTTLGSIIGAFTTGMGHPRTVFGINAIFQFMLIIASLYTSDELETNAFARVKDEIIVKYEEE